MAKDPGGYLFQSDAPKDALQPSEVERSILMSWLERFLLAEAEATAGDPGPVVLRRLNNTEYNFTIQDLTGVSDLNPTREFPVDSAAGEGFTNTGSSLVMSPSMAIKFLDAAKEIAAHAVLLPEHIRFSSSTSRSDWTNEALEKIKTFYAHYTDQGGGKQINLQGIVFDTNKGGRLPVERYLQALFENKHSLKNGSLSPDELASSLKLNQKYLQLLLETFDQPNAPSGTDMLLQRLRTAWHSSDKRDINDQITHVRQWQESLWKFSSVGHIGKKSGPKAWQEAVDPVTSQQEVRWKVPTSNANEDLLFYLQVGDAGDGNDEDIAVLENPRFVSPGRPDLMLRDVQSLVQALQVHRKSILESTSECLTIADEVMQADIEVSIDELAAKHHVAPAILNAWLEYLGIRSSHSSSVTDHLLTATASIEDIALSMVGREAML